MNKIRNDLGMHNNILIVASEASILMSKGGSR